ncbi:MAG: hypothetical protein U7127_14860 [Phormidium sp.]
MSSALTEEAVNQPEVNFPGSSQGGELVTAQKAWEKGRAEAINLFPSLFSLV